MPRPKGAANKSKGRQEHHSPNWGGARSHPEDEIRPNRRKNPDIRLDSRFTAWLPDDLLRAVVDRQQAGESKGAAIVRLLERVMDGYEPESPVLSIDLPKYGENTSNRVTVVCSTEFRERLEGYALGEEPKAAITRRLLAAAIEIIPKPRKKRVPKSA